MVYLSFGLQEICYRREIFSIITLIKYINIYVCIFVVNKTLNKVK